MTPSTPNTGNPPKTKAATNETNSPPVATASEEHLADVELEKARNRAQGAYVAARDSVGHGLQAARVKAAAVGSGIKDTAAAAKRRAELVKSGATERYNDAREGAIKLANEGETWVKEHPTSSVLSALAIGAVAGCLASLMLLSRRRRPTDTV
ncbi:MAG TPA: hypothetical protein VMT85_03930 [Thermoanaerobaculia bacterium]|nr:hypothetical protein [Thermoanaerobaculia bacterium]